MNSSKYPRGLASIPLPPVKKSMNAYQEDYQEYSQDEQEEQDWDENASDAFTNQDNSLPFYIEYAKPELWSIKKREAKIKERYDTDQKLISKLTSKRRDLIIHQDRIIQRQGPVPNLLSKDYHETVKFDRLESKIILPLPSYLNNSSRDLSNQTLSEERFKGSIRKKSIYSTQIPKQRYPPKLLPIIHSAEVDKMLIQKPLVIYLKRIKG